MRFLIYLILAGIAFILSEIDVNFIKQETWNWCWAWILGYWAGVLWERMK